MGRYGLLMILVWVIGEGSSLGASHVLWGPTDGYSLHQIKAHRKKKKTPKARPKKSKKKQKGYSAQTIDNLLQNYGKEGKCNRLNCASNLQIAKSCLPTKASHRKHKHCFRAFCAYACNDKDYQTKPDVYDFCNRTCSSKKYINRH